jgi:hypothetical protein
VVKNQWYTGLHVTVKKKGEEKETIKCDHLWHQTILTQSRAVQIFNRIWQMEPLLIFYAHTFLCGEGQKCQKKMRPAVNSINVLWAAFARKDPASAKKAVKFSYFFALFGYAHIKADRWWNCYLGSLLQTFYACYFTNLRS